MNERRMMDVQDISMAQGQPARLMDITVQTPSAHMIEHMIVLRMQMAKCISAGNIDMHKSWL